MLSVGGVIVLMGLCVGCQADSKTYDKEQKAAVKSGDDFGANAKYKIINPGCCACCQEKGGCTAKRVKVNMQIAGTNRCMKMETCEHCKAAKGGVCPTTVVVTTGGKFRMRAK